MEKTKKAMKAARIMVWFHFSFTALGLVALFLMTTEVIMLDWLAFWIIVLAIALNAFFAVMWYGEAKERKILTRPIKADKTRAFPMISLIVSTYNQEATIAHCVRSLFKCASDYRGPCEIVFVDDGSTDGTYESAWATLDSMHKELPHIHIRTVKHLTHLGQTEATRTGSNKAMGEYVILTNATSTCDSVSLNNLIDSLPGTEESEVSHEVTLPPRQNKTEVPRSIQLIRAGTLRCLLDKEITGAH